MAPLPPARISLTIAVHGLPAFIRGCNKIGYLYILSCYTRYEWKVAAVLVFVFFPPNFRNRVTWYSGRSKLLLFVQAWLSLLFHLRGNIN